MKRRTWALTLAAVAVLIGAELRAAPPVSPPPRPGQHGRPDDKRTPPPPPPPKEPEKKPILFGEQAEMAVVCELTEGQQKRIADLNRERQTATERFDETNRKKFAAIQADLDAARRRNDKAAAARAQEELNALNAEKNEIYRQSQADILAVLTPQQRARWNEARVMKALRQQFPGIEFSEEQLARLHTEYLQAVSGGDASADQVRWSVTQRLSELMNKELLTEDQKTLLALQPVLSRYQKITFTAPQLERIKAVYRQQMAAKTADIRTSAILKKVAEFINASVLTDEQLKTLGLKRG